MIKIIKKIANGVRNMFRSFRNEKPVVKKVIIATSVVAGTYIGINYVAPVMLALAGIAAVELLLVTEYKQVQ